MDDTAAFGFSDPATLGTRRRARVSGWTRSRRRSGAGASRRRWRPRAERGDAALAPPAGPPPTPASRNATCAAATWRPGEHRRAPSLGHDFHVDEGRHHAPVAAGSRVWVRARLAATAETSAANATAARRQPAGWRASAVDVSSWCRARRSILRRAAHRELQVVAIALAVHVRWSRRRKAGWSATRRARSSRPASRAPPPGARAQQMEEMAPSRATRPVESNAAGLRIRGPGPAGHARGWARRRRAHGGHLR